ncbi:MAG: hypothetical protein A2845_01880 [Candidatus Lloydbacteria bacterium RIFCSPHIGHO2_01_FULL_49_22]|uniref:Uncharacterized protein n=1 Tax=Candidatus Lloydbacteria bacterium RIFCSPHIGHO2_01_FULL_49_22 TaxID=1798658 RepID=A0A1G2CUS0_9BACT|nr:MAG: hypothetical protein A2845_01880 [Candidatus Lloydbacteria bacterium RIFCSPHIGHO2_01_FULL_49_22]
MVNWSKLGLLGYSLYGNPQRAISKGVFHLNRARCHLGKIGKIRANLRKTLICNIYFDIL